MLDLEQFGQLLLDAADTIGKNLPALKEKIDSSEDANLDAAFSLTTEALLALRTAASCVAAACDVESK